MSSNAARLNRLQIREQQELNRQRQLEDERSKQQQEAALRHAKEQYSHVKGHGYGRGGSAGGATDDVEIRVYVRECDTDNAQHYRYQESESAEVVGTSGAAGRASAGVKPRAGAAGPRATPNARAVPSTAARPSVNEPTSDTRGKVPKYLQKRKAELASEKDAIATEAERQRELAKIPPGHRLVSETEKEVTLAKLDERRKELETELGKIPLRFDTQTIRNKRAAIEDELRQIESTRIKYSTKKPLYIPLSA